MFIEEEKKQQIIKNATDALVKTAVKNGLIFNAIKERAGKYSKTLGLINEKDSFEKNMLKQDLFCKFCAEVEKTKSRFSRFVSNIVNLPVVEREYFDVSLKEYAKSCATRYKENLLKCNFKEVEKLKKLGEAVKTVSNEINRQIKEQTSMKEHEHSKM